MSKSQSYSLKNIEAEESIRGKLLETALVIAHGNGGVEWCGRFRTEAQIVELERLRREAFPHLYR